MNSNSSLNGGSPSNKSLSSANTPIPSNTGTQATSSNGNLAKHWSQKKHESCISSLCIEKSNFLQKLRGGSDSGQFIYMDSSLVTTNSSLPIDSTTGKLAVYLTYYFKELR